MNEREKEFVEHILFNRKDIFTYSSLERESSGFRYIENRLPHYSNFTVFVFEKVKNWAKKEKILNNIDWSKDTIEVFEDALKLYFITKSNTKTN